MIASAPKLHVSPYRLAAFTHDRGGFSALRDTNVLIYFPHGFGDWVHLSRVLPLLEASNRYWMTRYGDDNVSLMDRCSRAQPAYLGLNGTHNGDGEAFGNRHFGLDYDSIDGTERELHLPDSLLDLCGRERIEALLWTSFPDLEGRAPYPYHSKARNLLQHLIPIQARHSVDLAAPLKSALSFQVDASIAQWVESRLRNILRLRCGKLCLIVRNGYTTAGKNWGHSFREDLPPEKRREGEECRDFMRLMRCKDKRWTFLVIEDRLFEGDDTVRSPDLNAYSYAEVFGPADGPTIPFGLVMKVLVSLADLSVGVPAGPFHLCMAKPDLPSVGIWIEQLPSWLEEPKDASIHVISSNIRDRALDRKPGSFFKKSRLNYNGLYVETRVITGDQVLAAAEKLL